MNDSDISDLARMLPVPDARDFQADRQLTLKEHLLTEFRIAGDHPAAQVQPRPVLDPAARRGSGGLGRPQQRRWLVPLAAAVAVLAVVAGALAAAGVHRAQRTPSVLPPTAPIQTSLPPYYVSLTSVSPMPQREPQAWPVLTTATVRATLTGAVIASVAIPWPYREFVSVSAAADDRYFVLAAQYGPKYGHHRGPREYDGFVLLHINPTAADPAARATLTALPAATLPPYDQPMSMALSPDGRLLATVAEHYADPFGPGRISTYLRVYNLATGRSRTWTGAYSQSPKAFVYYGSRSGAITQQPIAWGEGTGGLSWRQDSRFLAVPSSASQLRLLDVNARGHDLARDSKPLTAPCQGCNTDVTPDGHAMYVEYTTAGRSHARWDNLVRFTLQTRELTAVNKLTIVGRSGRYRGYNTSAVIRPDDVLWTSYDGSEVIVANVRPGAPNAGIYSGGRYTPIPWPANIVGAAW